MYFYGIPGIASIPNEPIVNHGSGNFSLLHVSNFVVMCSISFSPNFLHTKKLSLKRILKEIFWKKNWNNLSILIRYLKMSDHKNWRFRPLTLIKYLFAINFVWFFSIRMIDPNEFCDQHRTKQELIFEALTPWFPLKNNAQNIWSVL